MADNPTIKATPAPSKKAEAQGPDTSKSGGEKEVPIGTVADGLNTEGTKEYKSPEENQKGDKMPADVDEKEKAEAPITSLAQLREYQIENNVPAVERVKQRDEVKKLEEKILEEGAKHVRLSSAERSKQ